MITQRAIEQSAGDVTPAAALAVFSRAFEALVSRGTVVTAYPLATDGNILVFRYLLDAVATASTAARFERRHFDHDRVLGRVAARLSEDGQEGCARAVDAIRDASLRVDRGSGDYIATQRLAFMKRMLDFSIGLALEMDGKGLWPASEPLALYRSLHDDAVRSVSLPVWCLAQDEMLELVATGVRPSSAPTVLGFRGWKPY